MSLKIIFKYLKNNGDKPTLSWNKFAGLLVGYTYISRNTYIPASTKVYTAVSTPGSPTRVGLFSPRTSHTWEVTSHIGGMLGPQPRKEKKNYKEWCQPIWAKTTIILGCLSIKGIILWLKNFCPAHQGYLNFPLQQITPRGYIWFYENREGQVRLGSWPSTFVAAIFQLIDWYMLIYDGNR